MYKKNKKNPKKLQIYAKKLIPGISQLFGKRPELYLPGGSWPTYYSRAKGIQLWGIDNKKFLWAFITIINQKEVKEPC